MKLKAKEYILGIFVILLIFACSFITGKFVNSDLGNFPFDSNVWGTFSDYLMIILTILSLYVIYRTLLIQIKSIDEQSKSINAQTEELNFAKLDRRKNFTADFEISINAHEFGKGEFLSFKYLNDTNLTVEVQFHRNPLVYDKLMGRTINARDSFTYRAKYLISKNQSIDIFLIDKIEDQLKITLEFTDYYGFKYSRSYFFFSNGKKSNTLLRHID